MIADIINFLSTFTTGPSIHAARTSISTTLHMNAGVDINDSIVLTRFMTGARNTFPLEPKYEDMWHLPTLLSLMETDFWPNKTNLSARAKANILVRISLAGRNGDVAYIHHKSMQWCSDHVKLRFYDWKTKRHEKTKFSRYMTIKKFPSQRAAICPYRALKRYMSIHMSDYAALDCPGIWLHFRGSKQILPGSLAGDTKEIMKQAGIHPKYGGATIRHATITFWRDNGVPMEVVMDRTGHRSDRLVRKFYDRSSSSHDIWATMIGEDDSSEEAFTLFDE